MINFLGYLACFVGGGTIGFLAMSLFVAAGRNSCNDHTGEQP